MVYNIKAHPTEYSGVVFRSRLEARWAAFFDIVGWKWEYEPIDLDGWTPDFEVTFPCTHSECYGKHVLLVEVKPYRSIEEFEGHPCMEYDFGVKWNEFDDKGVADVHSAIPADASAAFGISPNVTSWTMVHGCGGGVYNVQAWAHCDIDRAWKQAGNITQYKHKAR